MYKCKLGESGPVLAAKLIKMNDSEGAPATAIREVSILRQLNCVNVVKLHKIIYKPGQILLILEYVVSKLSIVLMNLLLKNLIR